MKNNDSLADFGIILELMEAFRRSKTMFAAVALGVFDALDDKPRTLRELANLLSANEDGLEQLLNACVGLKLLGHDQDKYRNTEASKKFLCSKSPHRVTGYISYSNDVMWKLWHHLEDAVRQGTHRWQQAYGLDGPIFSHFFRTEDAKREFLMGMHGFGMTSSPHVVSAFDLSGFRCLADLGGATGHLAVAACQRYPNLRAIVFDLPEAIPIAREYAATTPVADRVEIVGGDFFVDPLPDADLFAVGRILHDWSLPKIRNLLRRIYEALPPGGGLLIAEKILDDDKHGPRWAQMQSLNMLTCTEGKERTLGEYRELLNEAGFTNVQGISTPSPLDAILARK